MAGIPERNDKSKMSTLRSENNYLRLYPIAAIPALSSAAYINTLVNDFVGDDVIEAISDYRKACDPRTEQWCRAHRRARVGS